MNIGSLREVLSEGCSDVNEAYLPDERWRKEHPYRYKLYKNLYYPVRTVGQGLGYIQKGLNKIEDTAPMRKLALWANDPGGRYQTSHNVANVAGLAAYGAHAGHSISGGKKGAVAGAIAGGLIGDYATQHDPKYLKTRDWTERQRKAAEDKYIEDMRKRHRETDRFLDSYKNDLIRTHRGR